MNVLKDIIPTYKMVNNLQSYFQEVKELISLSIKLKNQYYMLSYALPIIISFNIQ